MFLNNEMLTQVILKLAGHSQTGIRLSTRKKKLLESKVCPIELHSFRQIYLALNAEQSQQNTMKRSQGTRNANELTSPKLNSSSDKVE